MRAFFGLLIASLVMLCCGTAPSQADVIKLNQPLPPDANVSEFILSPDDSWVVFAADPNGWLQEEIFSVPLEGGTVTALTPPATVSGQNAIFPQITSDSQWVVYQVYRVQNDVVLTNLYSVPLSGGPRIELHAPVPEDPFFNERFQLSPDGSRVVYTQPQGPGFPVSELPPELYSIPVTGGPATRLDSRLMPIQQRPEAGATRVETIFPFRISPDSSRVVYLAYRYVVVEGEQQFKVVGGKADLYSVPLAGGRATKLNRTEKYAGDFYISPDSQWVVFISYDKNGAPELDSVPLAGGPVTTLTPPMAGSTSYYEQVFLISPDSQWVVYRAPQDTVDVFELYSVPMTGGPTIKLQPPLLDGRGQGLFAPYYLFYISPDSSRVVYIGDNDTPHVPELYSVPVTGGAITKLNPPLVSGGGVSNFLISPDNTRVIYGAAQAAVGVHELYSVPPTGGTATKLNAPLVDGGKFWEVQISPDSQWVVYLAEQEALHRGELYAVPLDGGMVTKISAPLGPGGSVRSLTQGRGGRGFAITSDSLRVVYTADFEGNGFPAGIELYSASLP